ncbi:unnamed protein product, partial [Linum tenue]
MKLFSSVFAWFDCWKLIASCGGSFVCKKRSRMFAVELPLLSGCCCLFSYLLLMLCNKRKTWNGVFSVFDCFFVMMVTFVRKRKRGGRRRFLFFLYSQGKWKALGNDQEMKKKKKKK